MKRMNYMKGDGFAVQDDPFTGRIIGLAMQVHQELGAGFLESVYHRALAIELTEAGIDFKSGESLEVIYKGKSAGIFVADLIIEKRLLVELKAVDAISMAHELQVVNYLKATGLDLGLILNFGARSFQVKRKYRERITASSELRLHEV